MSDNEQAREKAIKNVETEYHEIDSKAAWGILYQVRERTKVEERGRRLEGRG